jgi:prepilin-type N-terminal cleavage/methylation domain-containing protein
VKHDKGFTLVEMLVSMVLLSMVLLIASSAYSMFSERWNGRLGHFNQSVKYAKQLILVQESLEGIISYVVTNDQAQSRMYFEGNRNGFVAVTLRSLFTPEVSAIMRLQIIQKDDFTFSLIYQEATMAKQLLIKVQQPLIFSEPIVLFDNLSQVNFQYFGWPSLASKYWQEDSSIGIRPAKAWFEEYNSLDISLQPEQVKITFTTEQGDFILQTKLSDSNPNTLFNYSVQE